MQAVVRLICILCLHLPLLCSSSAVSNNSPRIVLVNPDNNKAEALKSLTYFEKDMLKFIKGLVCRCEYTLPATRPLSELGS